MTALLIISFLCYPFLRFKLDIPFLGQIPIVQSIREAGDSGNPVAASEDSKLATAFAEVAINVMHRVHIRNIQLAPTKKVKISRK